MKDINIILEAIQEKIKMGYHYEQLEVGFEDSYEDDLGNTTSGYYLSKINGWGSIPITEILVKDGEIDDDLLIEELDRINVAHCF